MHRLAAENTKPTYSNEEHFIYFFVDASHLLKTVQNCWYNSFGHSHSRALWVSHFSKSHRCNGVTNPQRMFAHFIINIEIL